MAALLVARPAPCDEAKGAYEQAVEAEARLEFARALEGYRRALALDPSAPFARRAQIRARDLAEHAEGDFAPLARLEAVRRSPASASDAGAIASLEAEARGFPPGLVRDEARMLVAEAYLRRLGRPAAAVGPGLDLADDARANRVLRAQALSIAIEALEADGQGARARVEAARRQSLSTTHAERFARLERRASLARGAWAVVGALALADLVALFALARAGLLSRALRGALLAPAGAIAAVVIASGGAMLAKLYDASVSGGPFVALAIGVLVCERSTSLWRAALGAAGRGRDAGRVGGASGSSDAGDAGDDGRGGVVGARLVAAALGVAGVAAVALLSLLLVDASFVEGFGL